MVTLLPEAFPGILGLSITGRALEQGLWRLEPIDLRAYGIGKHRTVDDTPAGGGPGMVIRPDVMAAALANVPGPYLYLSPRGQRFDQTMAKDFTALPGITLICGRFEGLDERAIEHFRMLELSLGDFILTGGEIAAMAVIDACVRLLPGVLGNACSSESESFSDGLLEHPHYTKPVEWEGKRIPEVLLSGDHAAIARWRREQAERITRLNRPDLWLARGLGPEHGRLRRIEPFRAPSLKRHIIGPEPEPAERAPTAPKDERASEKAPSVPGQSDWPHG